MYIYGKHTIEEGLKNNPEIFKTVYLSSLKEHGDFKQKVRSANIPIKTFDPQNPPRPVEATDPHQGVIADIDARGLVQNYKDFINDLEITDKTALVVLGEVQDAQNVGAVVRSAAGFGAAAILLPEHKQAPINDTVVKVSAGMAFQIPLVSIGNVNATLLDLKDKGFWIYGLVGGEKNKLMKETFDAPAVFVLGNESEGLRKKTREHCDILLSIPLDPRCESLNAATSMAVALYEWSRQHPPKNRF